MNYQNIIYLNRTRLKLTREQLAEKIDVDPGTIKKWENGFLPRSKAHAEKMGELFGDQDFVTKLYDNVQ